MKRRTNDNVLAALTLTQAHLAGESDEYAAVLANTDPKDLIAGLVDLVTVVAKVAATDAGVNGLLDAAFGAIAAPVRGPLRSTRS